MAEPVDERAVPGARRTLVFGANTYVGTNLVPALQARGDAVRACARNRKVLEARAWTGVELVEADPLDPATLAAALDGIHTAYYIVPAIAAGRDAGNEELDAAARFAGAAEAAGVSRIVYLGTLAPPGASSGPAALAREVGECLRRFRTPVTELRPAMIVGAGSAGFEVIRDLVYHLPVMIAPRWVQSKASPIALSNLVLYLVRLAELPEAAGSTYEAAGRDFLSYEEMMRRFAAVVGRSPRILRLPVLAPRFSSYLLGLVTTVPAGIARPLIGALAHDLPADDRALRALVPQELLGFTESVQAALAAEQANAVAARWTEGTLMYRAYHPDHAFYAKQASGSAVAQATAEEVWRVVTSIGGESGYFFLDELWRLRELADWLVGGPGFARGRRDPRDVRVGDAIDYWTVLAVEPCRRLTLNFGLKAPGSGILEFEIEPLAPRRTRVTVTAHWHPRGVAGLLYWAAFVPFHLFIFRGMTGAIARRAEETEAPDASA